MKMIIKSKGKKSDEAARTKFPNVTQILNIFDRKIINYIKNIIKVKRAMKSIGINDNS
jgi:hypothetical protein